MTTLTSEITEISLKGIAEGEQHQEEETEEQVKLLDLYSKKNKRKIISISSSYKEQQIDVKKLNVIHDTTLNMFRVKLGYKRDAALCYLPTRVKKVVEFYHIEIPSCFRNKGLGDLLVKEALNWAKDTNTQVIPSCSFIQQHVLRANINKKWKDVIVDSEEEGMELVKRKEIYHIID
ncbi:hypothetical protein K501DRAFT_77057 [Backusella circina FSU 941]|nr:hypothetical protein K501DRAFT_77057 [Backusella circina FSU 941]